MNENDAKELLALKLSVSDVLGRLQILHKKLEYEGLYVRSNAVWLAMEKLSEQEAAIAKFTELAERLKEQYKIDHAKLGHYLIDKSNEGQMSSNWQGGRVNGLGDAISMMAEIILRK